MKTRNDFKKICKEMNEDVSGWNAKYEMQAELTGFFAGVHRVSRGRNGVSTLLELQTRITEVSAIEIDASSSSSYLTVYLRSDVRASHGFGREDAFLVKLRKGSKRIDFSVTEPWNREDRDIGCFQRYFGYDISKLYPEQFESFKADALEEFNDKVKSIKGGESEEFNDRCLGREFTEELYSNLLGYELTAQHSDYERFKKLCELTGHKFDSVFKYTERHSISPDYVKQTKNAIEFGWESNQTYNSLPMTLKISKVKAIKMESLSDLGVEGAGYYSHHDRMNVRPEQVEAAKKFNAKFNKTKTQVIKAVIEAAKKGVA